MTFVLSLSLSQDMVTASEKRFQYWMRERALCVTKFNGVSVRNGEEEASRHSKGREERKKLDQ